MLGMFSGATVSSDLAQILLRGLGPAAGTLLQRAGIDPAVLASSQQRISAAQFNALWREIEAATDDANLGLHLGEVRGGAMPAGHVLFAAMLNSPTVGTALERYCRYHALMADIVQPRLVARGAETVLGVEPLEPTMALHRHHVECVASLVASVVRQLAEGRFEAEVHFRHPRPDSISEHHRILGPAVRFEQPADEVVLGAALLATPIARADAELLGILDQHAERIMSRIQPAKPWTAKVSRAIGSALCDGKPSLAVVAKQVATSKRSLQAKLESEGTSFQQVLGAVRRQLAESYLQQTEMSLSEIAFLLGFRDQSAFNHSFKRWTGQTPLAVREGPRKRS